MTIDNRTIDTSNNNGKTSNKVFSAMTTPKRKIGDIIEDARNFVRVGEDLGKPINVAA